MDKEEVFSFGVEGGAATIYRTPALAGGWEFQVEGTSMYLDEHDDEGWSSTRSNALGNFEQALKSVTRDASWPVYYPVTVHPDYQRTVWELVQAAAQNLPPNILELWKRRRLDWQRVCGEA